MTRTATTAALLTLVLLAACADPPAPAEVVEPAPPPADLHATDESQPPVLYEEIVAGIEAQGPTGAQAAWDAGKPAALLFAASW